MNSAKGGFERASHGLAAFLAAALGVTPISLAYGQSAWYVAPEASFFYPDQKVYDKNDVSLGISVGYQTADLYRFELGYYALELVPKNIPGLIEQRNFQLVGYWDWARFQRSAIYSSLGLGAARADFNGTVDTLPYATAGLGFSFRLQQSGRLSLDNEIRARYSYDEDRVLGQKELVDGQYLLSFIYTFWQGDPHLPDSSPANAAGKSQSETTNGYQAPCDGRECTPSPERDRDRDRDNVPDSRDRCPNTIPDVKVDDDGCMIGR